MRVECRGRRVVFESSLETLPNGRQALVDRVRFPDSVAVLPIYKGEDGSWRVVLVRQFRPSIGRWTIEAPAGTIKEGEAPEEAAIRELEEEAGLRAVELRLVGGGFVSPGYSTEYMRLYLALSLRESEARPEDYEVIEGRVELGLEQALAMAREGGIEDVKTLALLLAAERWVSEG